MTLVQNHVLHSHDKITLIEKSLGCNRIREWDMCKNVLTVPFFYIKLNGVKKVNNVKKILRG